MKPQDNLLIAAALQSEMAIALCIGPAVKRVSLALFYLGQRTVVEGSDDSHLLTAEGEFVSLCFGTPGTCLARNERCRQNRDPRGSHECPLDHFPSPCD
jgi:hypothetical protein